MRSLLVLTALFPLACGGVDTVSPELTPLVTAHHAPEQLNQELEAAFFYALDRLVVPASGGLAIPASGVLEIQAGQVTSYQPAPGANLTVREDGRTTEIEVVRFDLGGAPADASGFSFFAVDHEIEFQIDSPDLFSAHITSSRRGAIVQLQASGRLESEALRADFDLARLSRYEFDNDVSGSRQRIQQDLDGRIELQDLGTVTVDEFWDSEYVATKDSAGVNRPGSTEASAQSSHRTLNNQLTTPEANFEFPDIRLRRGFREGRPSDLDRAWSAEGTVVRNGEPFAQYRYQQNSKTYGRYEFNNDRVVESLSFLLRAENDGSKTEELERWKVY